MAISVSYLTPIADGTYEVRPAFLHSRNRDGTVNAIDLTRGKYTLAGPGLNGAYIGFLGHCSYVTTWPAHGPA